MSVVIPDEVLHATRMSATELIQEIAILLFQKDKIDTGPSVSAGGNEPLAVSAALGESPYPCPLRCDRV